MGTNPKFGNPFGWGALKSNNSSIGKHWDRHVTFALQLFICAQWKGTRRFYVPAWRAPFWIWWSPDVRFPMSGFLSSLRCVQMFYDSMAFISRFLWLKIRDSQLTISCSGENEDSSLGMCAWRPCNVSRNCNCWGFPLFVKVERPRPKATSIGNMFWSCLAVLRPLKTLNEKEIKTHVLFNDSVISHRILQDPDQPWPAPLSIISTHTPWGSAKVYKRGSIGILVLPWILQNISEKHQKTCS